MLKSNQVAKTEKNHNRILNTKEMKKILFLLLIVVNTFLWGQGGQAEYKVEFKNFYAVLTHNIQNGSSNSQIHVYMYYEDGSRDEIFISHCLMMIPIILRITFLIFTQQLRNL
jgi:hypothetical protein